MTQPKGYADTEYLQSLGEFVKHLKHRSYMLMQIQPGHKVLDVGCGPASDTIELAALVGQTGQVFGVDNDQAMIDEAEQRAHKAGITGWVKHLHGDSNTLPFETNFFNASRSERLFQHLLYPARTLSEMKRVTTSGGWIVVLDTDWATFSIDTPEVDIQRRLGHVWADKGLHNAYAGRQLYRLFKQQQLKDITVEQHPLLGTDYAFVRQAGMLDRAEHLALTAGIVTDEEVQRWRTSLEQADSDGVFFGSVIQVMAAGCKR
jgi:ubiquinone/menaquinone biosynthesis C-methylase UbiE